MSIHRPKEEALRITTEIVTARIVNSTAPINAEAGKAVGEYFQAIFNKVTEITTEISENE